MTEAYRGFTIDILPRKGFAGWIWYHYEISGGGLKYPIQSCMGDQTEAIAIDEAKEFIDEHLTRKELV